MTPRVAFTLRGSGRRGVFTTVVLGLVVIGGLVLLSALPGILWGTRLTPADAQHSVAGYLSTRAIMAGRPGDTAHVEVVRVRTAIFGSFSIRRNFVVEARIGAPGQPPTTRYFCFIGRVVSGECSRWNRALAW